MPTYDYECTKCDRRFEVFQSITARPLRKLDSGCEDCGHKAPVRRLIGSGAAVLFKGGGFYETDYRSDSYKKAAKAEKESATGKKSEGKSSDAGSSDTKKPQTSGGKAGGGKKKNSSD